MTLKRYIEDLFDRFEYRALWFSGGKDSRLLLETMIKTRKPFAVLRFDDGWSRQQRQQVDDVIKRHKLQAFSYPPIANMIVGEKGELSFVSKYAVDAAGRTALLYRDFVDDPKRCVFDVKIENPVMPIAPQAFDLHIVGVKFSDTHLLAPKLLHAAEWKVGDTTFAAPLADWTDTQVTQALAKRGIDLSLKRDTGNIEACTRCLHGETDCPKSGERIPAHVWDNDMNLRLLRREQEMYANGSN